MSLSVIIGDDEKGVDRFPSLPEDKIDTEPLRSPLPPPVEKVPVLSLEPVSPFLSFYESGHLETCLSGSSSLTGHLETCLSGEFPGYLETCLSGKVKGEGLEPSLLHGGPGRDQNPNTRETLSNSSFNLDSRTLSNRDE